jgi:predicted RNA methylase
MGKHETGYARVERDNYPTPAWVIEALAEHVCLRDRTVWECACGDGRMAEALRAAGCAYVYSTDIVANGYAGQNAAMDFLSSRTPSDLLHCDKTITNPPFGPRGKTAEAFIERCLQLIAAGYTDGAALLLPHDFDSAKTRARLFGDCSYFAGKITLRRRVKWFEHADLPLRNPKENTDWCLWSRSPRHPPIILYAPTLTEESD